MQRVAILSTDNEYSSHAYFEESLQRALQRAGIHVEKIDMQHASRESLARLMHLKPDATISFGLFSDFEPAELTQAPHTTLCLGSALYALSVLQHPLNFLGCVNLEDVQRFSPLAPGRIFPCQHAIDKKDLCQQKVKKSIPYLFLGTFFDEALRWERLKKELEAKRFATLCHAFQKLVDKTSTTYMHALFQAGIANVLTPSGIRLYYELEMLYRGYERRMLLDHLQGEEVHIYGASDSKRGWESLYSSSFKVFPPVSFLKSLELIQQAEVLVHSCPSFSQGVHERVLFALCAKTCVLSSPHQELQRLFSGKGVVFDPKEIKEKDSLEEPLKIIAEQYVWDHRVELWRSVINSWRLGSKATSSSCSI